VDIVVQRTVHIDLDIESDFSQAIDEYMMNKTVFRMFDKQQVSIRLFDKSNIQDDRDLLLIDHKYDPKKDLARSPSSLYSSSQFFFSFCNFILFMPIHVLKPLNYFSFLLNKYYQTDIDLIISTKEIRIYRSFVCALANNGIL